MEVERELDKRKKKNKRIKKIDPPFGYFGSKNKIAFQVCKDLPPHSCWVEVFCGSAAITLAKPTAPIEIINDINSEIINVFRQLRNNKEALCEQIALTPYSSDELKFAREEESEIDDMERARRFLVKSMMAVNGTFGKEKGGFSVSNSYTRNGKEARVSRWYNLPERLIHVADRLKNARIENRDGIDLMKKFKDRPATLLYLDPPYLGNRSNGYDFDANDLEFHKKLLSTAQKMNCMILISGYENDLYETMLCEKNGWDKQTIETSTRGVNGTDNLRTEVLWTNSRFIEAKANNRIPVEFTDKETKYKKVNPERAQDLPIKEAGLDED